MRKVRLSAQAAGGWKAFAQILNMEESVLIELIGQWLANAKDEGDLEQFIQNIINSRFVVASGPGAQAAGGNIINATFEEHRVAPEDAPKIIAAILESLRNRQPPPPYWGPVIKARMAEGKLREIPK